MGRQVQALGLGVFQALGLGVIEGIERDRQRKREKELKKGDELDIEFNMDWR